MMLRFLDVAVPTEKYMQDFLWEKRVLLIVLLVVLILVAVLVVNTCIIKKDKLTEPAVGETPDENDGQ